MSDKAKYVPNSYQTPNVFVDEIMPYLTPEEWVVLSYTIRHVMGWGETIGKRRAKISLSHFTEGIEGDNYRNGCGLSRQTVSKCLKSLIEYGILSKVGGATSDGQEYELTQTADVDKLQDVKRQLDIKRTAKMLGLRQSKRAKRELAVYSIDQSTVKTDSGLQHRPEVVYTIDTIKHTSQTHEQTQNTFPLATQDGGVDSAIGFDVEEIPSDITDSLSDTPPSLARRLSAYQVCIGLIATELAINDGLDYAALSESSKQGYIGHATALWKKDLKAIHTLCKITADEMAAFIDSRNSAKERLAFPSKDGVLGRAFARWREQSKVVETPVVVKALVPKTLPNGKVVYGEME